MEKRMEQLEVMTTKEGAIDIVQGDSFHGEENQVVRIAPDQVEILIQWLKEAKAEIMEKKTPPGKTAKLTGV